MSLSLLGLHLCVNGHRDGAFSGLLRELSLADPEALTLESPYIDRHLRCAVGPHTFTLGKSHSWRHHGHARWVGNWAWDAVRVEPACAADVLNFVLAKGYRWTCAAERFVRLMDAGEPFGAKHLVALAELSW